VNSSKGPGSREGVIAARVIVVASFLWLGIQLWISASFPWIQYVWDIWRLNHTEQRSLHLGFALFLAFLTLRSTGRISRTTDWVLAVLGAFSGSYLFLFYDDLAARPRSPTVLDIWIAGVGILVLIEAVRRVFGRVAALVLLVSSLAALIGSVPITWHGISRFLKGLWLSTEGPYGIPIGHSTHLALLCLMLGAVADRLGFASQIPHRFVGWMNRRRVPHKIPLVVPTAFDGHIAKWIMVFVIFWELVPGLVRSIRGPALLWARLCGWTWPCSWPWSLSHCPCSSKPSSGTRKAIGLPGAIHMAICSFGGLPSCLLGGCGNSVPIVRSGGLAGRFLPEATPKS